MGGGTSYAAMSSGYRPAGAVIPCHTWTITGGFWSFTPHFEQAPTVTMTLITPSLDKLLVLVKMVSFAVLVDFFAVGKIWTPIAFSWG